MMKKPLFVAILAALAAAGCATRVVEIVEPAQDRAVPSAVRIYAPLTTYKLLFDSTYLPNTFVATLDGKDVSGNVMPAAAPGQGTTLWMWDSFDGAFIEGTAEPGASIIHPGIAYGTGSGSGSGPIHTVQTPPVIVPSGGSTPSDCPVPRGFTWWKHKLSVWGQCSAPPCRGDELEFYPVHMLGIPRSRDIERGTRIGVTLQTVPPVSVPVTVRVQATNATVSLNNQPANVPITVTIPPGSCTAGFTITGLSPGSMIVNLDAGGIQRGAVSGHVY